LPASFLDGPAEDRPTVGDWLLLDTREYLPLRRLDRASLLKRWTTGTASRIQLIAANVDTLFITVSCNDDFNLSRIERYLSLAKDAGTHPVIVLTKADLTEQVASFRQQAATLMPDLPIESVNAKSAVSVAPLLPWCGSGQTIALVGSSGAGKSTLVNTLSGRDIQRTQAIREDDGKGRHTTTSRSLHRLPSGGWLIDTPGMRELGLTESQAGIADVFTEIEDLIAQCRFSDCSHGNEPGCAINAALASGQLDPRRWSSYGKLSAEETRNTATVAQRRKTSRERTKYHKSIQAKNRRKK
ncbi:MAG: ribosome small subunit-dependent GTPase A, partial [Alphaproteobacteria bacterium]